MNIQVKKFSGNGNTFYLLDNRNYKLSSDFSTLAKKLCGPDKQKEADGLLVLEATKETKVKMRIFNADGSEAQMCGNGARCTAFYLDKTHCLLETLAGEIQAEVKSDFVKIQLTAPKDIRLNMPLEVNERKIKVSFVNTGVPHVVVFVNSLKMIDVNFIGSLIRNHEKFQPEGTNVDFVEVNGPDALSVRTYERGVESETLACGTGAVASSIIAFCLSFVKSKKIKVKPASGEILIVEFDHVDREFSDVWLGGNVKELVGKEIEVN
jgi:diaminopimelate epimerase